MTILEEQKKIAMEARELIKEYRDIMLVFGAEPYKSIEVNETYDMITTIYEDNSKREYGIEEVSGEIHRELYGFGCYSGVFFEEVDLCKDEYELKNKYKELSKEEFIEYVGKIHYAEFRCVEICERLEEIESEFCAL